MNPAMLVTCRTEYFGPPSQLLAERDAQRDWFKRHLLAEPGVRGAVLDIGCGRKLLPHLNELPRLSRRFDGVDPSPDILAHPDLHHRWNAKFETADVPPRTYDLAYAHYVLEHVANPRPFFEKLRAVLKPGGAFWGLSPHATHPFCWATRAVQALRFKRFVARHHAGVNDYPAYSRVNTARAIERAARGLGFAVAEVHYLPYAHWDHYFPRPLRWLPHAWDRTVGTRFRSCMLLLAVRLTVGA